MLPVIAGLALFGAIKTLEAKMSGKIETEDWDNISTVEKVQRTASGVASKIEEDLEKMQDKRR